MGWGILASHSLAARGKNGGVIEASPFENFPGIADPRKASLRFPSGPQPFYRASRQWEPLKERPPFFLQKRGGKDRRGNQETGVGSVGGGGNELATGDKKCLFGIARSENNHRT